MAKKLKTVVRLQIEVLGFDFRGLDIRRLVTDLAPFPHICLLSRAGMVACDHAFNQTCRLRT